MNTYRIYVNGLPYLGEDPERTYSTLPGWSNNSFHTYRQDLNLLQFGTPDEPAKTIESNRCMKTEVERIIRRIEDGVLKATKIEIYCDGPENDEHKVNL